MARSSTFTVKDPVYVHTFPESFEAKKEQIDELPIRKPNGLDMLEIGSPVVFDSDSGKAELDIPKCYAMTERLSAMPMKILLSIDPGEMHDLFWLIASFFMRGRQAYLPALERRKAELTNLPDSLEPSPEGSTEVSPSSGS